MNSNEIPWIITIKELDGPSKDETFLTAGQRLYTQNCVTCHGADRKGAGNNTTLVGVGKQYTTKSFGKLLTTGRRMMPSFQNLTVQEREAIASYILNLKSEQKKIFVNPPKETGRSRFLRYGNEQTKFLSREGYPASQPPWGTLNALNLATGKLVWKIPLGEYPEWKKKGILDIKPKGTAGLTCPYSSGWFWPLLL